MRGLVITLTILGGLLPLVGVLWAWCSGSRRHRALDTDLTTVCRVAKAFNEDPTRAYVAMFAVREPTHTIAMESYTPELVERAILRSALDDLRGPALLASIGVVCATAGSLLSLYLS